MFGASPPTGRQLFRSQNGRVVRQGFNLGTNGWLSPALNASALGNGGRSIHRDLLFVPVPKGRHAIDSLPTDRMQSWLIVVAVALSPIISLIHAAETGSAIAQ